MPEGDKPAKPRKYVGIQFECCGTYTRIYQNRQGTAYEGRCPRCLRQVRLKIAPWGTNERFFQAW